MWDELKKIQDTANFSNKLSLLRKLYQSELGKSQEMQGCIRWTLEIVKRLRGIGQDFADFHVAALLLSGVPNSHEALVTMLDACPDDELTLEYVEYKWKIDMPGDGGVTQWLLHTDARECADNSSQGTQHERLKCFFCRRRGHIEKDCFVWKANKRKDEGRSGKQKAKSAAMSKDGNSTSYHKATFKWSSSESPLHGCCNKSREHRQGVPHSTPLGERWYSCCRKRTAGRTKTKWLESGAPSCRGSILLWHGDVDAA